MRQRLDADHALRGSMMGQVAPASAVERMPSIDAFRLLAMLGVIVIHATPFIDEMDKAEGRLGLTGVIFNQAARFAIPFFFTVSGYFWGTRVRQTAPLEVSAVTIRRLLKLFVFWTVVLLLPWDVSAFATHGLLGPVKVAYWNLQSLLQNPLELLFSGSTQSLWFLMALCWSVAIATACVALGRPVLLLVVAVALYVVGVLGQYADAPVGLSIRFNTLYGPFCGTLPFAIGFLLSGRTPGPRWFGIGVVILAVGYALHFTEVFHFWRTYDSYPLKHFDFSTWLLGLGLAMIGLSNRPFPGRDWLARYGRIALGIYLVQPPILGVSGLIGHYLHAAWWEVGQVIFVLVMAILVVRLLMRSRLLRQFVS